MQSLYLKSKRISWSLFFSFFLLSLSTLNGNGWKKCQFSALTLLRFTTMQMIALKPLQYYNHSGFPKLLSLLSNFTMLENAPKYSFRTLWFCSFQVQFFLNLFACLVFREEKEKVSSWICVRSQIGKEGVKDREIYDHLLLTTSTVVYVLGMRYARLELFHSNYHGSRRIICYDSESLEIHQKIFFTFGWIYCKRSGCRVGGVTHVIHLMLMRFRAFW